MKKFIILFSALALTFVSCSSDDDGGSNDPFVGNWRYFTSYEDGVEDPLDDCESQDTFVISSNGTFVSTLHDEFGGDCQVDVTVNGTWENLGNNTYSTTSDGDTYVQQVEFEDNKMYLDEIDGGVVYRDVFIRQ
ncbi:lipocalin family protein [Winogradskyella sp.]|jgi:hypothetical protein|uniref:lipocalin family protein n=1 Tax=Winogradskyella sp. TaxID=1883156 RepID=UPI0025DFF81D|nr:lipocalin family protein [Winogradskyella sp.]MCT4628480.1 lipocalin family protein [Winogradskyella sp.]